MHRGNIFASRPQEKQRPRPAFCEEITIHNVPFSWVQYMNSTLWGRFHVTDIEAFYVCWFNDVERPGFYFRFPSGDAFRIDSLGNQKCPLRADPEPLNEA